MCPNYQRLTNNSFLTSSLGRNNNRRQPAKRARDPALLRRNFASQSW